MDKKIVQSVDIVTDNSEEKNLIEALVRSYELLQGIIDNLNSFFVLDSEFRFIQANGIFTETTGYSAGELFGEKFSVLFDETCYTDIMNKLKDVSFGTDRLKFVSEFIRKDGIKRFVLLNFSSMKGSDQSDYILGSLEDISDRVEVESQLKKLSRAVEQSPASVIITDRHGLIEYVNPKFTQLTGYSHEEVIGKTPKILKSGMQSADFYKLLWDTLLDGSEWRGEFNNKKKNGELYWEYASISPIRNGDGNITHFIAVKEDITERKKAEKALSQSEETLRKKNYSMERDLQYAQIIIRSLLPSHLPINEKIKIDYRYKPLDAIGGDFFSFNNLEDGGFGVFIGDVAGHGVSAALFLSLVKSVTDRLGRRYGKIPSEYLKELNRQLSDSMMSYFLTALYGIFTEDQGGLNFIFAKGGHPAPILYRASDGSVELLTSNGKPISLFKDIHFEEIKVPLKSGDRLFLFTDGIIETHGTDNKLLDYHGFIKIIQKNCPIQLGLCLDAIFKDIEEFSGETTPHDDIILIGFEVI